MVVGVGDDDSALVIDTDTKGAVELARLVALVSELEQERAIQRREYLYSMVERINGNDSVAIAIDRDA